MADEIASVNTSPEEAIIIKEVLPENAATVITTTSFTNPPEIVAQRESEPPFGSRLRETVGAFRRIFDGS
jgi:hypothetical protein